MKKKILTPLTIAILCTGIFSSCNNDDDSSPTVTIEVPDQLSVDKDNFFPEDVIVYNNIAYVSGYGDGTLQKFDLTQSPAIAQQMASTDETNPSRWGLSIDESSQTLLNIANVNYDFSGLVPSPAKVFAYKISDDSQVSSWTLPEGTVGNSIVVANGYYYIGDVGPTTRIIRLDPNTGATTIKTDPLWVSTGFGFGGMTYANNGIYGAVNGKLWYIPLDDNGDFGTVSEVTGIDNIFADGMTWAGNNTIFYAENDSQDPENVGEIWEVSLTSDTTATAALTTDVTNNGSLNNPSGVYFTNLNGEEYLFVNESQIFSTPITPFKINIFQIQ